MGVSSYLPTPDNMKCFVILSLAACSYAAPAADADAQYLAYGHGLVGGVYASAPAVAPVATIAHAAVVPAVTYAAHGLAVAAPIAYHHAIAAPLAVAAPAVAAVKTIEVKAAPAVVPAAYHIAAPAAYHVAAPAAYHVATAPVVQHVGYQVHHQVHHVPQVTVQKHTSTHPPHHVINHAPVIGAFAGLLPVAGVPVVAAAAAEAEAAPAVEEA